MKSIHFSTICPGLSAGGSMVEALKAPSPSGGASGGER